MICSEACSDKIPEKPGKGIFMKIKAGFPAFLLVICIFLVTGCGRTAGVEPDTQEPQKLSEPTVEQEPLAAPQMEISREKLEEYEPDTDRWLVHTEYDTLGVSGEGYEAVSEGVRLWSEERAAKIRALSSEYAGYASADMAYQDAENTANLYSIYESLELSRADRHVISVIEMNSEYSGGAHGNYGYTGYTFDVESGRLLALADILKDADGFREAAVKDILQKLEETYGDGLFPDYADAVRDTWSREEGPNWYLDASGITFLFNPYEVGPYAMGDVRVTLPYEKFVSYIKEEYAALSGPGAAKLPENIAASLFLGAADSQARRLCIRQEKDAEYGEGPVYVELDDSKVEAWEYPYGWIEGAYVLAKEDGRTFLLLNIDAASDDFTMLVYELTDGTVSERDRAYGISFRNGVVNTKSLTLQVNLDVLGTYTAFMDYEIGADGKLSQKEQWFPIHSDGSAWKTLTNVKEVPVMVEGEETRLPIGSHINITATDNAGTARFHNEDTGEDGEISYTRGDGGEDTWTIFIDGIPDYEYFEMVPYAG